MKVPQQGILLLDADWTARIGQVTLATAHRERNNITTEYHSVLLKDVSPTEKEAIKSPGNVLINYNQEIAELKKIVADLRNENVELRGLKFHHISAHVSFTLVIVVIIILIILLIRKANKTKRIAAIQFPRAQEI